LVGCELGEYFVCIVWTVDRLTTGRDDRQQDVSGQGSLHHCRQRTAIRNLTFTGACAGRKRLWVLLPGAAITVASSATRIACSHEFAAERDPDRLREFTQNGKHGERDCAHGVHGNRPVTIGYDCSGLEMNRVHLALKDHDGSI
jgi:hypothetical protein